MGKKTLVMKQNYILPNGRSLLEGLSYEVSEFYNDHATIVGLGDYRIPNITFRIDSEGEDSYGDDCFGFIANNTHLTRTLIKQFCMEFMQSKDAGTYVAKKYQLGLLDIKSILHYWDLWVGKES